MAAAAEKKTTEPGAEKTMTLSGHLRELRNRLLVCLGVLLAAVVAGLSLSPKLVDVLLGIGRDYGYAFVYLAPQELMMQYVSTALIIGLVTVFPVILYEVWAFMSPGLKRTGNLMLVLSMVSGLGCFALGVWFAYEIMLPFMLHFLISLSSGSGVSPAISVGNYISFLMTVFVVFGAVFELPVLSVLLTWLGLLKARWMRKGRRAIIVAIFVIAAFITPPDVVSQIMVAIPMLALYELSILLCALFEKLRRTSKEETETGDEAK